jgi:integrase
MASDLLTAAEVQRAKPKAKPYKLYDGKGAFLLVQPNGSKLWRLKYRFAGKQKTLALGSYPEVSLADARKRRDEARRLLTDKDSPQDPAALRREKRLALQAEEAAREAAEVARQTAEVAKTEHTFGAISQRWLAKFSKTWSPATLKGVTIRLNRHLIPHLASRPIKDITAKELLGVLERIEEDGKNETVRRVRQIFSQIARFAIASDLLEHDVSAGLRGALTPVTVTHRAAVTDPEKVGALLRILYGYDGTIIVRCALKLAALTFVRPGELRKAEWSEIDFMRKQWSIPAERMKMREPHVVPLSDQAIAALRELHPLTGRGRYVFPSGRGSDRPMSDNAILAALRRMDIPKDEMTGHGFRAMARTILDEVLGVRVDLIEHQLAHVVKDPLGRAYNRTSFLKERAAMMQRWADYLDELRTSKPPASVPAANVTGGVA